MQHPLRHTFLDLKSLEKLSAQKPDLIACHEYIYLILVALVTSSGHN